jgi:predicted nucleotidyltransferase
VNLALWLDELPPELGAHVEILRRMLTETEKDPRMRALQVQGSIGRGAGDRYSDLDIGLVVIDEVWPAISQELPAYVHKLGEIVDEHYYFLPSAETPEVFRAWAHFPDGIQLDLLVLPAINLLGSGPDGRTLLDLDGRLLRTDHPMRLSDPATVASWGYLCWQNLTEVVKYLERGLPVAAAEWLSSARQATISCWAAAHAVEYAGFANVAAARLGSIAPWPDGLELAYPLPEPAAVLASALALAEVQTKADVLLERSLGIPPRPLAGWVRSKLELLRSAPPSPDNQLGRRSRRGK